MEIRIWETSSPAHAPGLQGRICYPRVAGSFSIHAYSIGLFLEVDKQTANESGRGHQLIISISYTLLRVSFGIELFREKMSFDSIQNNDANVSYLNSKCIMQFQLYSILGQLSEFSLK